MQQQSAVVDVAAAVADEMSRVAVRGCNEFWGLPLKCIDERVVVAERILSGIRSAVY